MSSLPEFVGTVHIFLGPYRGNPIALYMRREETMCHISPRLYPWNKTVGSGETPNKAAAAFEAKWKEGDLSADMYSGPHWEGGIKPEKPKPPPKPAAPKPAPAATDANKPAASSAATPGSPTKPVTDQKEASGSPQAEARPSSTTPKPSATEPASPPTTDPANTPQTT